MTHTPPPIMSAFGSHLLHILDPRGLGVGEELLEHVERICALTDADRRRGAELVTCFGQLGYVAGKGWVSLPGPAQSGIAARCGDNAIHDLEHDPLLAGLAEIIKNEIVDAARINAQSLGINRSWRVVEGPGENGPDSGGVAAIREGKLDSQIAGHMQQESIHQLGNGQAGFKINIRHRVMSFLKAALKFVFGRGIQ